MVRLELRLSVHIAGTTSDPPALEFVDDVLCEAGPKPSVVTDAGTSEPAAGDTADGGCTVAGSRDAPTWLLALFAPALALLVRRRRDA